MVAQSGFLLVINLKSLFIEIKKKKKILVCGRNSHQKREAYETMKRPTGKRRTVTSKTHSGKKKIMATTQKQSIDYIS